MKKIVYFIMTVIAAAFIVMSCSEDHEAPTFSPFGDTEAPDQVEATYMSDSDMVQVTWTMSNTGDVVDYVVAVSDSSEFNLGSVREFYTHMSEAELGSQPYTFSYNAEQHVSADVDSTIRYFTVSAVYDNEDDFKSFFGKRAEPDSALILRK